MKIAALVLTQNLLHVNQFKTTSLHFFSFCKSPSVQKKMIKFLDRLAENCKICRFRTKNIGYENATKKKIVVRCLC